MEPIVTIDVINKMGRKHHVTVVNEITVDTKKVVSAVVYNTVMINKNSPYKDITGYFVAEAI